MALVSMFFQTPTRAKIDQMELDVSMSESHEATASLSQSEIEDGSSVTDNVVLNPIRITIEGVVSMTPLNSSALGGSISTALGGAVGSSLGGVTGLAGAAANVGIASIGGLVSGALGDFTKSEDGPDSRKPEDVWKYLIELRNRRIPFDLLTALMLYEKMVITSLNVPRNNQTKGILKFSATLEQVKIVSAQVVNLGANSSLGSAASETTKLGKKSATSATSKVADDSSIAYGLIIGGG